MFIFIPQDNCRGIWLGSGPLSQASCQHLRRLTFPAQPRRAAAPAELRHPRPPHVCAVPGEAAAAAACQPRSLHGPDAARLRAGHRTDCPCAGRGARARAGGRGSRRRVCASRVHVCARIYACAPPTISLQAKTPRPEFRFPADVATSLAPPRPARAFFKLVAELRTDTPARP